MKLQGIKMKARHMLISDEYGAYTNSKATSKFLWVVFSHINNTTLLNAFDSLVL
jgi:hypothetical protein